MEAAGCRSSPPGPLAQVSCVRLGQGLEHWGGGRGRGGWKGERGSIAESGRWRGRPEAQLQIEICRDGELQAQGDKLSVRPGVGTLGGEAGAREEGLERAPRAQLAGQGGGTGYLGRGLASQCPRGARPPPMNLGGVGGGEVGQGSPECRQIYSWEVQGSEMGISAGPFTPPFQVLRPGPPCPAPHELPCGPWPV